ncbi:O-acyltransferase (WSD1-like) family protein [Striga hermonthica]|uniref:O-acyltransferase (WSD1-like) family protein n=1 Tax=Striga hermonthica TaxID=68872 RepID=A0A9N7ML10_STRHE|nr:O-acyltransferase (WSD1-like) family protein [Striga hermonthica]
MADTAENDLQPLTPASRLFLQPLTNQVINCAVACDHPIDPDALKAELQDSAILTHPRFSSLLVTDTRGRQHWRPTCVDLGRHVIIRREPVSSVNGYVADLTVSSPLAADKPLWEVHVLDRAVVFRVHHALGDGASLMSVLMSCCRRTDGDLARSREMFAATGGRGGGRGWIFWTAVRVAWLTLVYVVEFVLRMVWLRDRATVVSGGDGVELWPRRLATARFRLDDMKAVKGAVDGSTINDVLFGIISSGLSRYLDMRSPIAVREGEKITGMAMVNLRKQQVESTTRWGNQFGVILLPVYYHKNYSNPLDFVKTAKTMIDKKKLSLEALFTYKSMHLITSLFGAKFTSILNHRLVCNSTFTISNVIGPQEKVTLAGNPVKYIRVTSSSLPHAITMHMVSYAGFADMQILVAKDIITDPKFLAKCFEDALLEMKQAAAEDINEVNKS